MKTKILSLKSSGRTARGKMPNPTFNKSGGLYDLSKSFEYNLEHGPFFDGPIPKRIIPPKSAWRKIFDYDVMSSIGVAACPLTANVKGISLCSSLGYDVITHKTIRSRAVVAHSTPNIAYVEPNSLANSIGNASFELSWHCDQIAQARTYMLPGQFLMVSIFGTPSDERKVEQDFAFIANAVIEAGAQVVELNFSCPNAQHGLLYQDFDLCYTITKEVVRSAGSIPVSVKAGLFSNETSMRECMRAIARAGARGIAGINTIPSRVVNEQGNPYFGQAREISGVSGAVVFERAKQWIESVAEINAQDKLDLTIFGMGGITGPEQFDTIVACGADVALTATGALWDPYLAHAYFQLKNSLSSFAQGKSKQPRVNHENAI